MMSRSAEMERDETSLVTETSLDAAMRAPSTNVPDVVVLDYISHVKHKEVVDPREDLWLSSIDGRHQSAIIPIHVGPHAETFFVHRDILTKSEYFRRALDGHFREAVDQAIDLPTEDPALFSFVVAFLYEEKFVPIKPVSTVLVSDDKGKGKELLEEVESDEASDSSSTSDASARSRRRRHMRRRNQDHQEEDRRRKEPGRHRPDCNCETCLSQLASPPCWNCGVTRRAPVPRHARGPYAAPVDRNARRINVPRPRRRHLDEDTPREQERMSAEDIRTWTSAYVLSVDVYVCAQRYLMDDFMSHVAEYIVNTFEVAGIEAALPSVLFSCKTLKEGVSETDSLLKKIFARVGFLQGLMWKQFPEETANFFTENPELAPMIMKEMSEKREEEGVANELPAMERATMQPPVVPEEEIVRPNRARQFRDPVPY
ncbi:hypothetical protein PVAG01_05467 [Phlyctema vagabunda]|uniref:BTB domain-containing protein n=1 Tax=Phlyctema vagabunda TaxID=108571 RepID=A0ABR4PK54_9HELO